jgi:hypothetical protein
MRYKSELYKKEQIELSNEIINILELDENRQIILYHLDNDKNKTNKIMSLIPELRKYFMYKNIVGIENPEQLKRPWLSIIRHITKLTHNMISKDKQLIVSEKIVRTKIYTFKQK